MNDAQLAHSVSALNIAAELIRDVPNENRTRVFKNLSLFDELPFAANNAAAQRGAKALDGWFKELTDKNFDENLAAIQADWKALFAGSGAKAPLTESFYQTKAAKGEKSVAMGSLYKQYGLQVSLTTGGADDQLPYMVEFLSHLVAVEFDAASRRDAFGAQNAATTQRIVLNGHILRFLPQWHAAVQENAQTDYCKGIADLVYGFIQEFATRYNLEVK